MLIEGDFLFSSCEKLTVTLRNLALNENEVTFDNIVTEQERINFQRYIYNESTYIEEDLSGTGFFFHEMPFE